jgi:hypothetical protein
VGLSLTKKNDCPSEFFLKESLTQHLILSFSDPTYCGVSLLKVVCLTEIVDFYQEFHLQLAGISYLQMQAKYLIRLQVKYLIRLQLKYLKGHIFLGGATCRFAGILPAIAGDLPSLQAVAGGPYRRFFAGEIPEMRGPNTCVV